MISSESIRDPLTHKVRHKLASLQQTSRQGYATAEFLVQQAFFRVYNEEGQAKSTVMLMEPIPLTWGKSMPAFYACWTEFMQTPRELGHRSICSMHVAFDRGTFSLS